MYSCSYVFALLTCVQPSMCSGFFVIKLVIHNAQDLLSYLHLHTWFKPFLTLTAAYGVVVAFLNSMLAIFIITGTRKKKILAVRMYILLSLSSSMIIPVHLLTAWVVKTYTIEGPHITNETAKIFQTNHCSKSLFWYKTVKTIVGFVKIGCSVYRRKLHFFAVSCVVCEGLKTYNCFVVDVLAVQFVSMSSCC